MLVFFMRSAASSSSAPILSRWLHAQSPSPNATSMRTKASAIRSSRSSATDSWARSRARSRLARVSSARWARLCRASACSRSIRSRSASSRSARLRHGWSERRGVMSLALRKGTSSRLDTAKKNSASPPSLSAPKLLTPTTRPHGSSNGPPELPRAIGAVCRIVSNWRLGRSPEMKPRLLTGGWLRKRSVRSSPWARSTFIG